MPADKDDKQQQHQVNSEKPLDKPKLSIGVRMAMLKLSLAKGDKLLAELKKK